jgi:hypothetical protein
VYSYRKYGFVDKTGKEIISPKYGDADSFCEGLAPVCADGKWGFVDKTGKEVITFKYDDAGSFSEGLALVATGEIVDCFPDYKYGFVDKKGKEVIPPKYDGAEPFCEGLAVVGLYGKCGFVDKKGKEVINLKYDWAEPFSEGLAVVANRDSENYLQYGYVDKNDNRITPLKYDLAHSFSGGLAAVETDAGDGFIDKTGKLVIDLLEYYYITGDSYSQGDESLADGTAIIMDSDNGKYGFIVITGGLVPYNTAASASTGGVGAIVHNALRLLFTPLPLPIKP